jgi:hypothetical protein
VDRDFARFGSKAYAINKINTVDVTERRPHRQQAIFGWGILAAMSALLFLGGEKGGNSSGGALFGVLLCVLFGFLAYRAWKRSKIVEFNLMLVTSSHSVQAIKSEDRAFIQDIRDRIERAMAGRLE